MHNAGAGYPSLPLQLWPDLSPCQPCAPPAAGPFHLGRFSLIVGWVGVTWGCFISVILVLPTYYPVTNKASRG